MDKESLISKILIQIWDLREFLIAKAMVSFDLQFVIQL